MRGDGELPAGWVTLPGFRAPGFGRREWGYPLGAGAGRSLILQGLRPIDKQEACLAMRDFRSRGFGRAIGPEFRTGPYEMPFKPQSTVFSSLLKRAMKKARRLDEPFIGRQFSPCF